MCERTFRWACVSVVVEDVKDVVMPKKLDVRFFRCDNVGKETGIGSFKCVI